MPSQSQPQTLRTLALSSATPSAARPDESLLTWLAESENLGPAHSADASSALNDIPAGPISPARAHVVTDQVFATLGAAAFPSDLPAIE
jgi:hypothetical protein